MERRRFLQLGMVIGGTIVLGGVHRFGRSLASAAGTAIPTVDQLVMTNVVDNFYDVFAKRGKMGAVTVQRTALQLPMPLSEHGLASSSSDARRLIAQGGLRIDGEAATDLDIPRERLNGAVLQAGKRRFLRLTESS